MHSQRKQTYRVGVPSQQGWLHEILSLIVGYIVKLRGVGIAAHYCEKIVGSEFVVSRFF